MPETHKGEGTRLSNAWRRCYAWAEECKQDFFKQRKERERMDRADAQSRARQREELPQCGWTTKSRQRCTHPMPCPFHATARKKAAEAEAAAEGDGAERGGPLNGRQENGASRSKPGAAKLGAARNVAS